MAANLREFAGCEYTLQATGATDGEADRKMLAVVANLMDCHHRHVFTVTRAGFRIYVDREAVECLQLKGILPHKLDLNSLLGGL